MLIKLSAAGLALLVAGMASAQTRADAYPDKPIRLIVSSPPAGTSDAVARPVMRRMGDTLGRQIVIDNRAGASGNIGVEIVARSAPDGYTLLLGQTQTLAVNPTLYRNLAFDPLRDFAPVAMIASVEFLLVATGSLPANSVAELIKLARAKPGYVTFASASQGSVSHLAGEMLKMRAGLDMLHVPYKGAGPAVTDLIGGQVMLMFAGGPSAAAQVKGGRLKLLATSGAKRLAAFPGVPTVAEAGVPGFEVSAWWGVLAPAKTPPAIVTRLNREIVAQLGSAEVKDGFAAQGAEPVITTPSEFGAFIRAEHAKWAKVVQDSGARAE
jgi:tripartite-type tricarboxylate transporter receptor subunit TctC